MLENDPSGAAARRTSRGRTAPGGGLRAPAAAALLAALVAGACSSGPRRVALPDPGVGACGPEHDGGGVPAGTLTVVADGPADPVRLPHARSPAERLLVRHLHRNLVRVDCRGRLLPDLAHDWERAEDGRRWRFRLAPIAAPGGDSLTARSVVAAWRESRLSAPAGRPSPLAGITAEATGPRTLVVTARPPVASAAVFARPAFAVVGGPAAGGWPASTGAYRTAPFAEHVAGGPADALELRPVPVGSGPSLRIVPAGARRARDLIDAGADVVLTRDPGLLAYAEAFERLSVRPLPWDRTYLLLVPPGPSGEPSTGRRGLPAPEAPTELRRSLARFAVRGAARPAPLDGWWSRGGCPAAVLGPGPDGPDVARRGSGPAGRRPSSGRTAGALVHPRGDVAAADLAGRLVALAARGEEGGLSWAPAGAPARTAPRRPVRFERSLRDGAGAGFLLPVPHRALDPCRARSRLIERVPWLQRPGARIVPLVTTRAGLAVRRGLAGLRIDWDGVPRLGDVVLGSGP